MKPRLFLLLLAAVFIRTVDARAQGANLKTSERHQRYFDSIRQSNYKWTFPVFGKRLSKKGFDIPYPYGVMVNTVVTSQKVTISDLQVGINNKPMVPLDFIKFGDVNAKVQTIVVRPDIWILPFLDVYGLFGVCKAQTSVSINAPFQFTTEADFKGHSLGFGATLAGGYHRFVIISDINLTWTTLDNIDGSTLAKMISIRPGMNFRLHNPKKSIAFWVGSQAFFIGRTTAGTIDLNDLKSNASTGDLQAIADESAVWYQPLSSAKKEVVKTLAKHSLDERNGIKPNDMTVSYSLIKKPLSNWSMMIGGQFQFNHHWQVRSEAGFLGGKNSFMLSGNYRFR